MLDVRKPIGFLFVIIGAVLTAYALLDPQITTIELIGGNRGNLILNLNLPCGISMLIFGLLMLVFSYCRKEEAPLRTAEISQPLELVSAARERD